MKTRYNEIITMTFAVLLSLLIGGMFTGCATTSIATQDKTAYDEMKQLNDQWQKERAEDPALNVNLPEMTAEEHESLGDRHRLKKDFAKAFVQYEKSLALNSDNQRVQYKQGMLFLQTGKYTEAAESFKTVLKKEPRQAAAHEGLGIAFLKLKKYDKAKKHLRTAAAWEQGRWKSRNYLGNIYDHEKKYEKAIKQYHQAIRFRPSDGALYNNLGVSLSLAGRYDESVKTLMKALENDGPKEKIYNNLGIVLAKSGRYPAALDAFKKASNSAKAYNNIGCMYMADGRYQKASEALEKAIAVSPVFYTLANENLKQVQLKDAVEQAEK